MAGLFQRIPPTFLQSCGIYAALLLAKARHCRRERKAGGSSAQRPNLWEGINAKRASLPEAETGSTTLLGKRAFPGRTAIRRHLAASVRSEPTPPSASASATATRARAPPLPERAERPAPSWR